MFLLISLHQFHSQYICTHFLLSKYYIIKIARGVQSKQRTKFDKSKKNKQCHNNFIHEEALQTQSSRLKYVTPAKQFEIQN